MKALHYYQEMAQEMIQKDRGRDRMLAAMDAMWQGRWQLPESIADLRWVHKVVSTEPHDAIRAGTRVLSSANPRINVQTLLSGEAGQLQSDRLERVLAWHLKQASRRRRASVLRDVVLSALLYDEITAQVVYLPHQQKAIAGLNSEERNPMAVNQYGPFAVLVRNPRQVHVRYSDWMPEAVVLKKLMPAADVLNFWGKRAEGFAKAYSSKHLAKMPYVSLYDYMDHENRVVWALPQEDPGSMQLPMGDDSVAGIEILREAHGLGFLPWVARVGGTTLSDEAEHQRIPLLYSVYQAGQWETQNILESLLTSEVLAYAAAPRLKVEGPGDGVEVDYGEPGRMAYVAPGHQLSELAPPGMDSGLAEIAERIGARIRKSTVPRILQTGEFPSGTAYATLNLATQSGIKSLSPYKELAEEALGDILMQMLCWVDQQQMPLQAFSGRRGEGECNISIPAGGFDLRNVFVEVNLTPDVPTDQLARINAAAVAVRELGYSKRRALEQIGENDPDAIQREAHQEALQALALMQAQQKALHGREADMQATAPAIIERTSGQPRFGEELGDI